MTDAIPFPQPMADRSARGIASGIGRLISTGELTAGDRLPTVRAVAAQLDVSPTTVADAWRILQRHGAIATEGRRGTFVRGTRQAAPGRYWQVPVEPGTFDLDLSTGTPDPTLLPSLGPILGRLGRSPFVGSYLDAPVLPALAERLRADWPFPAESLTVVDGAQDALDRLVGAIVHLGDRVIVGDPEFPVLLDLLDAAGADVLPIGMDDEGPVVEQVVAAMEREPVALFLQPRAHNPTGFQISAPRARHLAAVVRGKPVVVIEDDHSGSVAGTELHSIGRHCPDQVVLVRSFSKSHGPDLRLAAVGGAAAPIDALTRRRRLGASWSSRLLQEVLFTMLEDPDIAALVAEAACEYGRRRSAIVGELADRGVTVAPGSGFNLWMPVLDEQAALISLAANGIGAAPGTPFRSRPDPDNDHLRISIGTVADGLTDLAGRLASAATLERRSPTGG